MIFIDFKCIKICYNVDKFWNEKIKIKIELNKN